VHQGESQDNVLSPECGPDAPNPNRTGFSFMDRNVSEEERYNALDADSSPQAAVEPVQAPQDIHPMLKAYYHGQLAQTTTFGIWWSLSSPIYIALLGKSGVGKVRIAYNAALCLVSPVGGGFAERADIRAVLVWTSFLRTLSYFVLIPALWVVCRSGWWGLPEEDDSSATFTAVFLAIVFLDGCNVALLNVVAIDGGGPDLLSQQHSVPLSDSHRGVFMSGHHLAMDVSMVVLAPVMATVTLLVGKQVSSGDDKVEPAILIAALGIAFLVLNVYSIALYCSNIPAAPGKSAGDEDSASGCQLSVFLSIWQGFKHVVASPPVAWRLVFFALEIALEDTMVAVVCAEYGMLVMAPNDTIHGNFWTNILIGAGKIGGVLTGCYMNLKWSESENKSYQALFLCCALGGISAMFVPVATWQFGTAPDAEHHLLRDAWVFGAIFLFFLFTTAPKIGFGALLQQLVGETQHAGLIYGFASAFITITDSLVVFGFSVCFEYLSLQTALWVTCGCFCFVGVVEWLVGPSLFLPKDDSYSTLTSPPLEDHKEEFLA